MASWKRYEELRPDHLAESVAESPVAFWPLGLLEHHGWHLPLGFDGIKAERICKRVAEQTGGVMLPTMWWGGGGGHDVFKWTLYQQEAAYASILVETLQKLVVFGFRAIVVLAGHYPWQGTLEKHLPDLQSEHQKVLFLWGTEVKIGGDSLSLKGDHAALEETSYGLCLFPEMVDMDALRSGRGAEVWLGGKAPKGETHPRVKFDPDDPLFAQAGEDSRNATAEHGEEGVGQVVNLLVSRIQDRLGRAPGDA